MTDADGRVFNSAVLTDHVWVADFIYTNCPAECPMMSSKMRAFSKIVNGAVRLVSISVDPANDTPAVLKAFAARYDAPTTQWLWITGNPETVHLLAFNTFHVGDIISEMQHSTKFALVDKQGFIRGYYSSLDADSMSTLRRDADALQEDN